MNQIAPDQIQTGDRIIFKAEWLQEGEADLDFRAVESVEMSASGKPFPTIRVQVRGSTLAFPPVELVQLSQIEHGIRDEFANAMRTAERHEARELLRSTK